jgi:hypothetical protein
MTMKGTRTRVPLASLKKRPLRIDPGSEEELKALARSWLADPLHDILVRAADLAIADGTRRVTGLELLGETEADVVLLAGEVTDRDLDRMAMVSAYHRSPLGGYDQACILRSMKEAQPGVMNKALADEMNLDGSMPTKLLAIFTCHPAVQEAAKAGKIGVTVWYDLSRSADQLAALHDALNGSSRDDLQRRRRHGTNGKAATVTTSSIPMVLGNGVTITFRAENITLSRALDSLADARKEIDDAIKRDHDARTFTALMKKRAKQMTRDKANPGG